MKTQEKKNQAIKKIAVPCNREELRRFLGMLNYYRNMIPSKTTVCKPLYLFTSAKELFKWLPRDMKSIQNIKRVFAEAILLAFPNFKDPFHVRGC